MEWEIPTGQNELRAELLEAEAYIRDLLGERRSKDKLLKQFFELLANTPTEMELRKLLAEALKRL